MINDECVKFETAKLLKKKGFDWKVFHFYDEDGHLKHREGDCYSLYNWNYPTKDEYGSQYCSAPTQQMACRWLRETHDIMIIPNRDKIVDVAPEPFYDYWCTIRHNGNEYWVSSLDLPDAQHYTEYEDVVEAALQYVLTKLI